MATTDIFLAMSEDGFQIAKKKSGADYELGKANEWVRGALNIDKVTETKPPGSGDIRCPGTIEVLSFSHKIQQIGAESGGRPRSVEDVSHGDFEITKAIDGFSPMLFRMCAGASYIAEAKVILFSAGGWGEKTCPAPVLVYTMSYVHISYVEASGGGGGIPTEKIGLKYGQMRIKHSESNIQRDWSMVMEAPVKFLSGLSSAGKPKDTRP